MSRPFRAIFNTITTKNTEPRLGAIFFSDPSFVNWIRWVRVDLSHQFYFMQVLLIKFSCKWPCSFDNTISGVDWPDEVAAIMLSEPAMTKRWRKLGPKTVVERHCSVLQQHRLHCTRNKIYLFSCNCVHGHEHNLTSFSFQIAIRQAWSFGCSAFNPLLRLFYTTSRQKE